MLAILSITSKEKKPHLQKEKNGTVSGLKNIGYERKAKVIIKVVGYGWNWVETDFVGLIFSRSHYNYLSVQSFEDSLDISSLGSTNVQWRFTDCNYINYNLADKRT